MGESSYGACALASARLMGHAQEFAALVVVAPPRMPGDLRAAMHPEVTERIVAEIPKDLAGHPLPEITRLLS